MADTNDNNENSESYEFPELDGYSPEEYEETQSEFESFPSSGRGEWFSYISSMWGKAIITIVGITGIIMAYSYFGGFFRDNKKTPPKITSVPKKPTVQAPKVKQKVVEQIPIQQLVRPNDEQAEQFRKNLVKLEINQRNINTNINDLEEKLNSLEGNVANLSDNLASMNQQLSTIVEKIDAQGNVFNILKRKLAPKKRARPKRMMLPPIKYYIQAIIPGRAWLIGSNGSTITVSKGSRVANYGIIRMVDAQQGRVITSSGKVIKFEPEQF